MIKTEFRFQWPMVPLLSRLPMQQYLLQEIKQPVKYAKVINYYNLSSCRCCTFVCVRGAFQLFREFRSHLESAGQDLRSLPNNNIGDECSQDYSQHFNKEITGFLDMSSFRISNLNSSPGTVGRKNGAAFGTFGGSFGLFLF